MMDTFASRLVMAREREGISRVRLSELTGKTVRLLGAYERGESQPPLETAVEMASALHTSLDWLCDVKKKERPDHLPYINVDETCRNIRNMISKSGLSPKEIKEALGLTSVIAVYKWISGEHIPNVDNIIGLAWLLGVTVDDIIVAD